MQHQDEYLDIVNERDEVIGKKLRSEVHAEGMKNYRVINAFIKNSEGKLFIPRRTAHKRLFPNCLDMSLGEHVQSGETYDEAFARGLQEELNLNITDIQYSELKKLNSFKDDVSAFMKVYEISMDETPPYNPNDFSEHFWFTPAGVLEKLRSGDKGKGDLRILIQLCYER